MRTKTLRTEGELWDYLRRLHEQEEPAPVASPEAQPAAPEATAPAVPAKPITVEDVIDKLNIVRSGKSTKDVNVKRELEEYVAQ